MANEGKRFEATPPDVLSDPFIFLSRKWYHSRFQSLGMMGDHLRTPLKPLITRAVMYGGFMGALNWAHMKPRDASRRCFSRQIPHRSFILVGHEISTIQVMDHPKLLLLILLEGNISHLLVSSHTRSYIFFPKVCFNGTFHSLKRQIF